MTKHVCALTRGWDHKDRIDGPETHRIMVIELHPQPPLGVILSRNHAHHPVEPGRRQKRVYLHSLAICHRCQLPELLSICRLATSRVFFRAGSCVIMVAIFASVPCS